MSQLPEDSVRVLTLSLTTRWRLSALGARSRLCSRGHAFSCAMCPGGDGKPSELSSRGAKRRGTSARVKTTPTSLGQGTARCQYSVCPFSGVSFLPVVRRLREAISADNHRDPEV